MVENYVIVGTISNINNIIIIEIIITLTCQITNYSIWAKNKCSAISHHLNKKQMGMSRESEFNGWHVVFALTEGLLKSYPEVICELIYLAIIIQPPLLSRFSLSILFIYLVYLGGHGNSWIHQARKIPFFHYNRIKWHQIHENTNNSNTIDASLPI